MAGAQSFLVRFKWGALASLVITFLAILPQLHFWIQRGSQWQGAYVVQQPDELLYSAYVNGLIEGRPRRNDPVSGRDDHPLAPLPESLFSIQAVPPYLVAFPARVLGVNTSSAFIGLRCAGGLLASLSVFWLLSSMAGNRKTAALGVLVVLVFGALAGGQGLIGLLLKSDVKFLGLPFLRSYEPSVPFPLFFVLSTLTWRALTAPRRRTAIISALLAGCTFALLVFSYFYLWTTAFAWLICLTCLWLLMRADDRRKAFRSFLIISVPSTLALSLYFHLLMKLPATLDRAQVLTLTHRPDLLRIPEIIGAFILVALGLGQHRKKLSINEPRLIFIASFALLPFLVFNQQVITGRSIQPFHYEILIANYVVLVGFVLLLALLLPVISRRATLLIIGSCFLWGVLEVGAGISARRDLNVRIDEMVPVLLRLKELATDDGTWAGLRDYGKVPSLVFSPELRLSGVLPTWAPHGSLLATGSGSFQTLSDTETKERLYLHFYYCNRNKEYLRELLNDRVGDTFGSYYARSVIFGPERVVTFLGRNVQPIRQDEIEQAVAAYDALLRSFSRNNVLSLPLGYAITPAGTDFDFSNVDRWYVRDGGERMGAYDLYRLELRE